MKRHLLVTNDFPPKVGGIQNYLWELWSRLDPYSFVVLTASSDDGAAAFDAEQAERGIRIERVPGTSSSSRPPTRCAAVPAAVEAHEIDLVLLDPALPLGLLGPHLDVPYGVILHGAEVTVPGRLPGSRAALARVLRGAAARRLGRQLPGGRGPTRRARTSRRRWSRSRRASTPAPSSRCRGRAPGGPGRARAAGPGAAGGRA